MFGPKLTTVFASRWRAVWFAASVLLFVYMTVPEAEPVDNGQSASANSTDGLSAAQRESAEKALATLDRLGKD